MSSFSEIWTHNQHPQTHDASEISYTNPSIPGARTIGAALDRMASAFYPKSKSAVLTIVHLPKFGNEINDLRIVLDGMNGKPSLFRWEKREEDVEAFWHFISDIDFGAKSLLESARIEMKQEVGSHILPKIHSLSEEMRKIKSELNGAQDSIATIFKNSAELREKDQKDSFDKFYSIQRELDNMPDLMGLAIDKTPALKSIRMRLLGLEESVRNIGLDINNAAEIHAKKKETDSKHLEISIKLGSLSQKHQATEKLVDMISESLESLLKEDRILPLKNRIEECEEGFLSIIETIRKQAKEATNEAMEEGFSRKKAAFLKGKWEGDNLGSAEEKISNVFTAGEFFGMRLENSHGIPESSAKNVGRVLLNIVDQRVHCDLGYKFKKISTDKFEMDFIAHDPCEPLTIDLRSSDIKDARRCLWQICDNQNDFERLNCKIKTPNEKTVIVEFPVGLSRGTFRVLGVE